MEYNTYGVFWHMTHMNESMIRNGPLIGVVGYGSHNWSIMKYDPYGVF